MGVPGWTRVRRAIERLPYAKTTPPPLHSALLPPEEHCMTSDVLRRATFRREAGEATSESSGSHQESMGGFKFPACVRRLAGKRARMVKWRSVQQVEGALRRVIII